MQRTLLNSSLLTLVLLSPFSGVSAGTMGAAELTPSIGAGVTGLHLLPGASNLIYAVHTKPLPVPAPSWSQEQIKPDFHSAFNLDLLYNFSNRDNQIRLDWLHFDASDSASASATGSNSIAPPYYFGPEAQAMRNTAAVDQVKFNIDNVNLVFSHLFNGGGVIQFKSFAGINAANLKQKITTTYTGRNNNNVTFSNTTYNSSKYTGIGPRLGFDASAFVSSHISIVTGMSSSLMVGSMKSATTFLTQGEANPTPVKTGLADISQTKIVPQLDGKIALAYQATLDSGSTLMAQLGYMYTAYIDGINQVAPSVLVPNVFNDGTIAIETAGQHQSNLDLGGPFIKLAWMFDC